MRSRWLAGGLLLGSLFGVAVATSWAGETGQPVVDVLSEFFVAPEVAEVERYRQDFAAATAASEVAGMYRRALALEKRLLAPIRAKHQYADWPLLQGFREADLDLPGLAPACAAECTEPALVLVFADFIAVAAETESEADDAFFRLLIDVYDRAVVYGGKPLGWTRFFERTWDYGGHSLLGGGLHLALLLQIDAYNAAHELFSDEVVELRQLLMEDLFERSKCSGMPAKDILVETGQILEQVGLTNGEVEQLTQLRKAFEEPAAHGIEVDCREQLCPCNSG